MRALGRSGRTRGPLCRRGTGHSASRPVGRPAASHDAKCLLGRTGGQHAGPGRLAAAAAGPFSVPGAGEPAGRGAETAARPHSHDVRGAGALEPAAPSQARRSQFAMPGGTPRPRWHGPLWKRRLRDCRGRAGRCSARAAEPHRSPFRVPEGALGRFAGEFSVSGPPFPPIWQLKEGASASVQRQAHLGCDWHGLPDCAGARAESNRLAGPDSPTGAARPRRCTTMEVHCED